MAVKFTDKNASGLNLALDEDFQTSKCFSRNHLWVHDGAVEPYTMIGLQPTGATRVLRRPQLVGLVLAACPTAKNGVAVTHDYQASAS